MKNVKTMKYEELENEVRANRSKMAIATREEKRSLINRNHALMVEMDARWNAVGNWWK